MNELQVKIIQLIIDSLDLEDVSPEDIGVEEPLFNEGLGLDSIDALELGMAIQQQFGVRIDAEDEATREHFRSVASLAAFVSANQRSEQAGSAA
ncbi:phosphopantetheine-binding protein [Pseudohalioglobus lutimaris]|uniref:Acyl carrier protein n=1 Tax=Pseudohalioglobus lutimaris TaxID=1737061 RepID=A0A2N5WZI8_9GAMM|nr:phosphopantetheine-binding protein [Pseudohalioglobus lutimaris]PLW67653.1 acyl carrier protein [Pseudohalioglobus lutimaris]